MRVRLFLLAFLALAQTAPLAAAQNLQPSWVMPVQAQAGQQLVPLRAVLDMLRGRFGGEYVSHRVEDGGRPTYVIRWRMPDGVTIQDFRVDAVSGQLQ